MKQTQGFNTFQQRKDTFLRRGRFRWPYIKYSSYLAQPDTLASAGFVFSPAKDAPDNVQCFHCGFELTGWEPTDDPFAEHFAHEPNCSYAKLHCQVRVAARGNKVELAGWPFEVNTQLSTEEREAERQKVVAIRDDVQMRLDSFGSGEWPHTGRAGWNVTPEKLAAAGFYYTPEFPADDTATCAFCGYALGDWEADDEPIAEHSRRSADCLFFRLDSVPGAGESAALASPEGAKRRGEPEAVVVMDSDPESDASATSKRQRLSTGNVELHSSTPSPMPEPHNSNPSPVPEPHNSSPSPELEPHNSSPSPVPEPHSSPVHSADAAEDIDIHEAASLESDSGESEISQPTAPAETSVNDAADRMPPPEEADTQLTETQVAPSSPGNMAIDEIAHSETLDQHVVQTEESSLIPDEWEFDSGEEEMTVEEFIRACCDQKIAALEASAGEMVDAFMKRAESTRERICSLTW
ncbi:hypothetical protein GGH12_004203 [Coemansia sp. RSA 1822]|nr:hypothetical protein LPJ76_004087 [Coemansia sp. RSA 638]KAJ2561181.1 hypothetical protein GGH12_004203 [Coemansia sp. RSA 1822]